MTSTSVTLKEGRLLRYGSDGGLLSFKKGWKECYGVLTEDSNLKLYKDQTLTSKVAELYFDASVLWLAFGKDAEKYDPPKVSSSDEFSPVGIALSSKNYIAVPKDKNRDSILWFAAYDKESLHSWIRAIASSVKNMSKPPILGTKRADYRTILQQLRDHFKIDDTAEEWEVYWLYSVIGGSFNSGADEIYSLYKQRTNLSDDDDVVEEPIKEDSSLQDVLDNWKLSAAWSAQATAPKADTEIVSTIVVPQLPKRISVLNRDHNGIFILEKDESNLTEEGAIKDAKYENKQISTSTIPKAGFEKMHEIQVQVNHEPHPIDEPLGPKVASVTPSEIHSIVDYSQLEPTEVGILRKNESYNLTEEDQNVVFVPYPMEPLYTSVDKSITDVPAIIVLAPKPEDSHHWHEVPHFKTDSHSIPPVEPISHGSPEVPPFDTDLHIVPQVEPISHSSPITYETVEVQKLEKSEWDLGMVEDRSTEFHSHKPHHTTSTIKSKSTLCKDVVEVTEYRLIEEMITGASKQTGSTLYRTSLEIEIRNA